MRNGNIINTLITSIYKKNTQTTNKAKGDAALLTRISFSNYRAFTKGTIRIRPITILVGANSIGKTSILQAPLILKQTAAATDRYKAALKIHGKDVNIGDPINLFHNRNYLDPLELNIDFTSDKLHREITERIFNEFSELLLNIIEYYHYALNITGKNKKSDQHVLERIRPMTTEHPYEEQEFQAIVEFLNSASELINSLPEAQIPSFGFRRFVSGSRSSRLRTRVPDSIKSISVADIERYYYFLIGARKITSREFRYSAKIGVETLTPESTQLRVQEVALGTINGRKKIDILRFFIEGREIAKISSDLADSKHVDNYHKTLDKALNAGTTIFSLFSQTKQMDARYHFPEIIRQLMCSTQSVLKDTFDEDQLGHIGPLRAHPKRFYFLDTADTGSSDGNLLVEALRENDELRNKVNEWLSRFAMNINVAQLQEIIYRLSVRSGKHDFDLDITDVGFGISQILPILVEGFISPPGKIILIEQPEIHLHPKMQGELADLFIDIANVKRPRSDEDVTDHRETKYLVVETHSEYFLNRLRRRISERRISHSDVALYFIEKSESGSIIRGVPIPISGQFEWPEEFYEDDLNDTLSFLKNAASSASTVKN